MKKIKQWFCRHEYKKIGFYEDMEHGIRYSVRVYRCKKCGKEIHVDGRIGWCVK